MTSKAKHTDCLIIGFNDYDFPSYIDMVHAMGERSGAYRDLSLAFVDYNGKSYRSLELLSHFYNQKTESEPQKIFHNMDFLWPTIIYLGSFLSQRGYSFDFINLFHFEKAEFQRKLEQDEILTIAITTTLYVIPQPIIEIVQFIRQYNQKVKILVGGPFINNQTTNQDEASLTRFFNSLGADIYVDSSEGEQALVNTLAALKNGTSLAEIDNLIYHKGDGTYGFNNKSTESSKLDDNMVDYQLFSEQDYGGFVSVRTAKSCPFFCAFCGFPARAGKYKYLPVELVEKELDRIKALGTIHTITFLDDTFNVPKGRFKQILRMMIEKDYGFKWNSYYRSDHGDEETIRLMAESGCEGIFLGVESGSDYILEKMNKKSRQRHYHKAIRLCREAGIMTYASMIIGFPGETLETIQETIKFIETAQPDFFRVQLWYADPMTPIWQEREALNIQGEAFHWTHNTLDFQQASDWIDELFLSIQHSLWMPQWGFDLWSIFYLQRQGMSQHQMKTFVRSFNEAIKEKLLFAKIPISGPVLDNLQRTSQFEQIDTLQQQYSAADYAKAKVYWQNQFAEPIDYMPLASFAEQYEYQGWQTVDLTLPEDMQQALSGYDQAFSLILLAYHILLSRLSGDDMMALILSQRHEQQWSVYPLLQDLNEDQVIKDQCQQSVLQQQQSQQHHIYADYLTGQIDNSLHKQHCVQSQIGIIQIDDKTQMIDWEQQSYQLLSQVNFNLMVVQQPRLRLGWHYHQGLLNDATINEMNPLFVKIMSDLLIDDTNSVGVAIGTANVTEKVDVMDDVDEFNF